MEVKSVTSTRLPYQKLQIQVRAPNAGRFLSRRSFARDVKGSKTLHGL